ncbi:hypothetical protein M422DRAFT_243386 [Sphaerobolus stellatus SS14]|nr:hypothetical protein M422DRAFT_243386 [Sphaerobolus stellatus SS14]
MSADHSSGNEPLIPSANIPGIADRQRASTSDSAAGVEAGILRPLPRTPPSEAYNPVTGPYPPTIITSSGLRGSPPHPTYPIAESPLQETPPRDPPNLLRPRATRTGSRRVDSGYVPDNQQEGDLGVQSGLYSGDEGYGGSADVRRSTLSRRATGVPGLKTASQEDEKQAIDWIVPVRDANGGLNRGISGVGEKRRSVEERLQATLDTAKMELVKYQKKAHMAGLAINVAQFAQIVSNALITGLSASTSNRHAQIGVSALGALGTIISAFLVRVRGTREPDRSTAHAQSLEKFIRELEAFILDEGGSYDRKWDAEIKRFRTQFDRMQSGIHQSENGQPVTDHSVEGSTKPTAPGASLGGSDLPAGKII